MNRLSVVLAVALTSFALPALAQQTVIINTGSSVTCASLTYNSGGQSTTVSGFTPAAFTLSGALAGINATTGPGAAAVTPALTSFKFTANTDQCAEQLIADFLNKTSLPTVTITSFRSAGQQAQYPYLKITLSSAYVASWAASDTGSQAPSNSFSIVYTNLCYSFTPINANGTVGTAQQVCHSAPSSMAP